MVPEKRKLMVVGAAVAAALALTGCAPAGYNAADYSGGAEPAANAVDAEPTAEPEQTPEPDATETAPAGGEEAKLSEDDITSELTGTKVKRMGKVVVDQEGWVLYRFDDDKNKPAKSNCDGDCAKIWPPAYTENGEPEMQGVDPADVGTVTRSDGTKQLTLKGWPLYRYAGDRKPGQWLGQNVGAKWFVVNPDGSKNLTCLPKASKPIAVPQDEDEATEENDSGAAGSDYSY